MLEIIHIWSNHTFCADSVDNIFWGIRETMPVYVLLCFLVCTAQHTQCRDSTDWGHWGLVHLTQRWASRLQLLRRRVQHAIAHFQKFWLKSNWKQKNYTRGHSVHSHQCLYWQCLRNYRKCSNFLRQTNIKKKNLNSLSRALGLYARRTMHNAQCIAHPLSLCACIWFLSWTILFLMIIIN